MGDFEGFSFNADSSSCSSCSSDGRKLSQPAVEPAYNKDLSRALGSSLGGPRRARVC